MGRRLNTRASSQYTPSSPGERNHLRAPHHVLPTHHNRQTHGTPSTKQFSLSVRMRSRSRAAAVSLVPCMNTSCQVLRPQDDVNGSQRVAAEMRSLHIDKKHFNDRSWRDTCRVPISDSRNLTVRGVKQKRRSSRLPPLHVATSL